MNLLKKILIKIYNKISISLYNFTVPIKYKIKIAKSIKISDEKLQNQNIISDKKIAIHFHVFYVDLLEEIYAHLVNIRIPFTLFITVVNEEDLASAETFFNNNEHNFEVKILKVENRGRDIYPFYQALHDCYKDYDVIAHFHTKKSLHTDFGNIWRKYLYNNLLGSKYFFENLISYLYKKEKIGFVTTPIIPLKNVIEAYFGYAENRVEYKANIEFALNAFCVPTDTLYNRKKNMDFPCGNMFVAKTEAIKQFFEAELDKNSFPDEEGQLTGTLQHYVELMWKYIVLYNGFEYCEAINK